MVLTVTLVMILDYWCLNLLSLTLVAIFNFGHSGLSIGEGGDGYKWGEGDSDGSVGSCDSDCTGCSQ